MSDATRGRLVVFEGIDGCGKSTQARLLGTDLQAVCTFEPGDTPLGMKLRNLLLLEELSIAPRAEALLMAADRAQHVAQVIEPALSSGSWVVTDRFSPSTLAYQGAGQGLAPEELQRLVSWAEQGIEPDLVVLIDITVAESRRRLGTQKTDRLEDLDVGFHERVRASYLSQAEADPDHWVVFDGEQPVEVLARQIRSVVKERLG